MTRISRFFTDSDWGFVEFNGEVVGIGKEGETLAGEFIDADGFDGYALVGEMLDAVVQGWHSEGEMAQALGFRVGGAFGRVGKGKEFDLRPIRQRKIEFPGLALFAEGLADHRQTEDFGVELFGSSIVGTDDGDVVNAVQNHAGRLDMFHGNGNRLP
jgi:hypothetical protein